MGRWIAKNLPGAVILCRNPWELLFYCGEANRGVALPNPGRDENSDAQIILAIARYYHVTHYFLDATRQFPRGYIRAPSGNLQTRGRAHRPSRSTRFAGMPFPCKRWKRPWDARHEWHSGMGVCTIIPMSEIPEATSPGELPRSADDAIAAPPIQPLHLAPPPPLPRAFTPPTGG